MFDVYLVALGVTMFKVREYATLEAVSYTHLIMLAPKTMPPNESHLRRFLSILPIL